MEKKEGLFGVGSMPLLDILHKYHGDIGPDVCSVCSDINGWDKEINRILDNEYPQWRNQYKGIPADNPVWDKFKALWKEHEVQCLAFSYDDWSFAICRDHLHTIINFFDV